MKNMYIFIKSVSESKFCGKKSLDVSVKSLCFHLPLFPSIVYKRYPMLWGTRSKWCLQVALGEIAERSQPDPPANRSSCRSCQGLDPLTSTNNCRLDSICPMLNGCFLQSSSTIPSPQFLPFLPTHWHHFTFLSINKPAFVQGQASGAERRGCICYWSLCTTVLNIMNKSYMQLSTLGFCIHLCLSYGFLIKGDFQPGSTRSLLKRPGFWLPCIASWKMVLARWKEHPGVFLVW